MKPSIYKYPSDNHAKHQLLFKICEDWKVYLGIFCLPVTPQTMYMNNVTFVF